MPPPRKRFDARKALEALEVRDAAERAAKRATTRARASTSKPLPKPEAQTKVLAMLRAGSKVRDAMAAVGRSEALYRDWMTDGAFRDQVRIIRRTIDTEKGPRPAVPDFPEFCATELGEPLATHHLRIWDVLNGREPRDLHPAIQYERGRPNYVLALAPPEHGKTTAFTLNYVTWRIVKDPFIKVILLSRAREMAGEFLLAIKDRLTSDLYLDMQVKYQPPGGWRDPDRPWTAYEFYIAGSGDGKKDPTVRARGVKSNIYGARAQLIVGDDIADLQTAGQYEVVKKWIGREIVTRLSKDGTFLIVGTRVAAPDIYAVLRDQREFSGAPVYTFLAQPAVLEQGDTPAESITLWPEAWDGPALDSRKATIGNPRSWALIYQQVDVPEDATFPAQALECSVNRRRAPGPLTEAGFGHRAGGMTGLYVIAGLDPAVSGHTAIVVAAVDRATRKRYILDCWDKANCAPDQLIAQVKDMTTRFGVKQWVVEKNAFQKFLTQLHQFRHWLYSAGVRLREHQTTGNKWDADFGVAALAGLFLSCGRPREDGHYEWERTPDSALIELPNPRLSRATAMLVEQLAVWHPTEMGEKQLTDLVMALWFAEIGVRDYLGIDRGKQHYTTPQGATRHDLTGRTVINLNELAAAREAERRGA